MNFLIFVLLMVSDVFAADLQIVSAPDNATIYIRKANDSKRTKLGVTPLKLSVDDILTNYADNRTFILEIEKEGYENYNILTSLLNTTGINLDVKLKISQQVRLTKNFDAISTQLFEAQRLLRDQAFDEAIATLNKLAKEQYGLSVIHEILGSAYYLKKDFQKSLSAYRKAFSLNSENIDAYNMKLYLEKSLGVQGREVANAK